MDDPKLDPVPGAPAKKPKGGVVRWSYLVPRLALLALIWLFFFFAFDPLLKYGLVRAGEAAVGAKVEIGSIDTGLFPPTARLERVTVANPGEPMRNLVEFDEAAFELEGKPLLKRRFVVRDAAIVGLRWDTPRKTSGAIAGRPPSMLAEKIKELGRRSQGFSLKIPELKDVEVEAKNLKSLQAADEAKARWESKVSGLEERVRGVEPRVDGVKKAIDGAGRDLFSRAKATKDAAGRIAELKKELDSLRSELEAAPAAAKADIGAVEEARRSDVAALMEKLQLPKFDAATITEFLLGPELSGKLAQAAGWMRRAREWVPEKPGAPKAQRVLGEDVEFPAREDWPAFLLRQARLSASGPVGGKTLEFKGTLTGFTSNPKLYGQPATVDLRAEGGAQAALEALLDHTREVPADQLSLTYVGLPVGETTLGDPLRFAVTVSPALGTVRSELKLVGDRLSGDVAWRQDKVALAPRLAGADPRVEKIVRSALAGIHGLEVRASLGGTLEEPSWKLESNLGRELAAGLQASLGREADEAKKRLQAKVDAQVQGRIDALKKVAEEKPKELLRKLGDLQSRLPKL